MAIDGVEFDACHSRRVRMLIDGVELSVIHVLDFRTNKLATGRHKDLADVERLDEEPDR